jgi:hypothetical protein
MAEDKKNLIPYQKAVRVGNFKLWRSKSVIAYMPSDEERAKVREESKGKMKAVGKKVDIDVLNISNLDGSWKTQIPSTCSLYSVIVDGYATSDEKIREQFLAGEVFSDMEIINTCGSVILHHSFKLLFNALNYPVLFMTEQEIKDWAKKLYDKKDKKLMKEHVENLLKDRKEFFELIEKERKEYLSSWQEQVLKHRNEEETHLEAIKKDEIAEEALDLITKNTE